MTRFGIRIVVWSSLYKPVRTSKSSHKLVFKSPMYRVHNKHNSKSGPGLLLPVRIARTSLKYCSTQPYIHGSTTQTCIHDYLHIHKYTYKYTPVHMHNTYTYIHLTHIYTSYNIHNLTHSCIYMCVCVCRYIYVCVYMSIYMCVCVYKCQSHT